MQIMRVQDGVAVEVMVVPEGLTLIQMYGPVVVSACVEAEDDVQVGWITTDGGQTFTAPEKPAPIAVASVTSAQAKIQLRRAGLRDKVDQAVQAAGGEVLDWFTDARTWERNNQYVLEIGDSLGLQAPDIDELFAAASQIAV